MPVVVTQHSMILGDAEVLDVIKEEQGSHHSHTSSVNINDIIKVAAVDSTTPQCVECDCKEPPPANDKTAGVIKTEDVETLIQERVVQMRKQFEQEMQKQMTLLKERFDFILQNEQVRTSCMMREAHRERQEKIYALQSQLECKNLASLMYVMCSERRRGKLEKLRIIEEYTRYIRGLQKILMDAQKLILDLSRGYKTAARVDHEWKEKMTKIIKEFQAYIINYNGGTPESNQYIFDLPQLLKTNAPLADNPIEDPCDREEEEGVLHEQVQRDLPWWEQLEGDCRPFVMFGDMADFTPSQRRETLKTVKAAKTAPRKWKTYVFNEMFLRSDCSHLDFIKNEREKRFPLPTTWECHGVQTLDPSLATNLNREESAAPSSRFDLSMQRLQSMDTRGMGSILKIITAGQTHEPVTKANLLGARDSMEIKSTTILKEKHSRKSSQTEKLEIGHRKYEAIELGPAEIKSPEPTKAVSKNKGDAEDEDESHSVLGSIHNDSLQIMTSHKPDPDHKINYEKVCPMEKCKRMQVNSFIRSLPPYMRVSPFMHFEQTFDNYETCTPDQLEILKTRIEAKKSKKRMVAEAPEDLLEEWGSEIGGVSCQTSQTQMYLPPCTCELPASSTVSSEDAGGVFRIEDLLPIKQALNEIQEKCFFSDEIDFNRFKVIGQESDQDIPKNQEDFKKKRFTEIQRILKKYPSLCDLFQANTS